MVTGAIISLNINGNYCTRSMHNKVEDHTHELSARENYFKSIFAQLCGCTLHKVFI